MNNNECEICNIRMKADNSDYCEECLIELNEL